MLVGDNTNKGGNDSAWTVLSNFTPANPIALDYRNIAEAWVATRLQDSFVMTDSGWALTYSHRMDTTHIATLTTIAEKDMIEESPFAMLAREMLYSEFGIYIAPVEIMPIAYPEIVGFIDLECKTEEGMWNVYMMDEYGASTTVIPHADTTGKFWFEGKDVFTTLDTSSLTLYQIIAVSPFGTDTVLSGYLNLHTMGSMGYITLGCSEIPESALSTDNRKTPVKWNPYGVVDENSLEIFTGLDKCEILLFDLSGREIINSTVGQKTTLPMHNYPQGIYILRFVNLETGEIKVQKLVYYE